MALHHFHLIASIPIEAVQGPDQNSRVFPLVQLTGGNRHSMSFVGHPWDATFHTVATDSD